MAMATFIGDWSGINILQINKEGWFFFRGRNIWTAWREDNKRMLIMCKNYDSLRHWVTLACLKKIDCPMCLNCQIGGCGHCNQMRRNHVRLLKGEVKNYDIIPQ
jgi:hypothetical protein